MAKENQHIEVAQGQGLRIQIAVVNGDGSPKTMTGGTPIWHCFIDEDEALSAAVISKTDGEISLVDLDGTDDGIQFDFVPDDTDDETIGQYHWESWITPSGGGDQLPVSSGPMTLKGSVIGRG